MTKRPPHRPRAFKNEKDLKDKVDAYFKSNKTFLKTKLPKPKTVTGLCVYLNITRDTHARYLSGHYDDNDNNFSDTLRKSKEKIEAFKLEGALLGIYNAQIAKFDLQVNHGYIETERKEITGKDGEAFNPPVFNIVS